MKNRSAPSATVTPVLVYEDVREAIEWLCRAFGFTEKLRAEHSGSVVHAQLDVGECSIMIGRQGGPYRAPRDTATVSAYVLVDVVDVDTHFAHAKANGAQIVSEPHNMPFGERAYTTRDHAGQWWTFSQHVADVAPEEWGAKVAGSG